MTFRFNASVAYSRWGLQLAATNSSLSLEAWWNNPLKARGTLIATHFSIGLSSVTFVQGFIQTFVSGGSMKLSGGRSSGRRPRVEARSAEWGRGLRRGCPPPQYGGPGVLPPGKFWNLRRNLVHFGNKLICQLCVMLTDGFHSYESQAGPKIVWDASRPSPSLPPLRFPSSLRTSFPWGSGGVTPGKILKLEAQFGAFWQQIDMSVMRLC